MAGSNPDPYRQLAAAIVAQAVLDYRAALVGLNVLGEPKDGEARWKARRRDELRSVCWDAERFFRSEWFVMLCDLDGESLMRLVRRQAGAGR